MINNKHVDPPARTAVAMPEAEWVLAEKYEEMTGVTIMSVHQRRKKGIWVDGKQCKVVLRRLYINVKEADKWVNNH